MKDSDVSVDDCVWESQAGFKNSVKQEMLVPDIQPSEKSPSKHLTRSRFEEILNIRDSHK